MLKILIFVISASYFAISAQPKMQREMICFDTEYSIANFDWINKNKAYSKSSFKSRRLKVKSLNGVTSVSLELKKDGKVKKVYENNNWTQGSDLLKNIEVNGINSIALFQDVSQDLSFELMHEGDTSFDFKVFDIEFDWSDGVDVVRSYVTYKGEQLPLLNRCFFNKRDLSTPKTISEKRSRKRYTTTEL